MADKTQGVDTEWGRIPLAKEVEHRYVSYSGVSPSGVVTILEAFHDYGWRSIHVLQESTGDVISYTIIGEKQFR